MMKQKINIIKLYLPITILWLYTINVFSQTSAQISIPFEVYDNAGGQKTLYFGLDQTATDEIDFLLGESDLPPFPPIGAFDARFILPKNNFNGSLSSWKDYRFAADFPYSGTVEHRFKYQNAGGATLMYFSWDLPPEVTGLIQDLVNGALVNVPISGTGVYELANFAALNQMKLMIYYNNIITEIKDEGFKHTTFKLEQNYPNPFNPSTKIKFTIPFVGTSLMKFVQLKVYDVLGNEVVTLINGELTSGEYEVEFNTSSINHYQTSGVYFYQLKADNYFETKKMLFLK